MRPYEERFLDWGEWEERALRGPVPFEVLDALAELVVGKMDEGAGFLVLPVVVFPFLHMLNLDVHCKSFSYKLDLVPEAFNEHAAMAFDLVDPVIYFIEPTVYPLEPLIQPMNKPMKTFVQVLNKFRVHAASAVKLNGKLLSLSCQ